MIATPSIIWPNNEVKNKNEMITKRMDEFLGGVKSPILPAFNQAFTKIR
jgi:hypothetical protein